MTPNVLVPIDFSDAGEAALSYVADLFRTSGATYTLLHVVPIPPPAATVPTVWAYPNAEDLKALEQQVVALAAKHGITAKVQVAVSEDVGVSILRAAGEAGANLIAMPTHGRGGLKRAVLGSVADYVSRHSDCPVLSVRGYDKKK